MAAPFIFLATYFMIAFDVLSLQEAYRAINLDTIILLFGMMIVVDAERSRPGSAQVHRGDVDLQEGGIYARIFGPPYRGEEHSAPGGGSGSTSRAVGESEFVGIGRRRDGGSVR